MIQDHSNKKNRFQRFSLPTFDWLTLVNVRLPDGLTTTGDVLVSVKLRGGARNKVVIGIRKLAKNTNALLRKPLT